MLVGFTHKTSKVLPKLFCRNFRHCVVIFPTAKDQYIMVQIGTDGLRLIPMGIRELKKLKSAGWVFIHVPTNYHSRKKNLFTPPRMLTCVGFAKLSLGMKKPFVLTPDQLYRKLKDKR